MSDEKSTPKIGAGHAQAMWRTGLDELRSVILNEANVGARGVETGVYGTATPGEVTAQREADPQSPTLRESPLLRSFLKERSQPAEVQPDTAPSAEPEPARDHEPEMARD